MGTAFRAIAAAAVADLHAKDALSFSARSPNGQFKEGAIIRELGEEQGNFFNKGGCVGADDSLLFLNFP